MGIFLPLSIRLRLSFTQESSWNPFASPCETVKCNGEHYWTGYDLTYSNCKLELEWENGKQGPGTGSVGRSRAGIGKAIPSIPFRKNRLKDVERSCETSLRSQMRSPD